MVGRWAVAGMLALVVGGVPTPPSGAQHFRASRADSLGPSALLQLVVFRTGDPLDPCEEDHPLRDTVFLEVRPGDSFRAPFSGAAVGGFSAVLEITPVGDVKLELPPGLRTDSAAAPQSSEETLLVSHRGARAATRPGNDAGEVHWLVVLDSLPRGAELGFPAKPRAPVWESARPRVVESEMPQIPMRYRGRRGDVLVRVHLNRDGSFERAELVRGVSWELDRLAMESVRSWNYAAGAPCRGYRSRGDLVVRVPFR